MIHAVKQHSEVKLTRNPIYQGTGTKQVRRAYHRAERQRSKRALRTTIWPKE